MSGGAIPDGLIIKVRGKEVATYRGLLGLAHQRGLNRISTTLVQVPGPDNGNTAIVTAEVEVDAGTFAGIGDASPKNVGKMIVPHIIRMAETRAKARAIRDAVNIGIVALDELGGDDHEEPRRAREERHDRRGDRATSDDVKAAKCRLVHDIGLTPGDAAALWSEFVSDRPTISELMLCEERARQLDKGAGPAGAAPSPGTPGRTGDQADGAPSGTKPGAVAKTADGVQVPAPPHTSGAGKVPAGGEGPTPSAGRREDLPAEPDSETGETCFACEKTIKRGEEYAYTGDGVPHHVGCYSLETVAADKLGAEPVGRTYGGKS